MPALDPPRARPLRRPLSWGRGPLAEPGGTHPPRAQPQLLPLTPRAVGIQLRRHPARQRRLPRTPCAGRAAVPGQGQSWAVRSCRTRARTAHVHLRPQRRAGRAWPGPWWAWLSPVPGRPRWVLDTRVPGPRNAGPSSPRPRPSPPRSWARVSWRQELPVAEGRGWMRVAGPGGVSGDRTLCASRLADVARMIQNHADLASRKQGD